MRRLMAFVVAPAFLILLSILVLVILALVVNELKRGQPAIVHLKEKVVADGDTREGTVTKTDKYVTINSESHGVEVFTWDQVRYISEKEAPPSRKLDRIIDLIDLLSKLGIAATVLFFMIGLYQYGQAQKWEREKFLAAEIKEFIERKPARNAMNMLDSLALYKDGRMIELFPEEKETKDRKVFVTNDEIYKALTTTPHEDLNRDDDRSVTIRDCFDTFLSYMGTFDHYIEQGLITQDALSAQVGYWIELLGPEGKLSTRYKDRIFNYARQYELNEIEDLIAKYQRRSGWDRVVAWFMK
jgi:hypothetical protein